MGQRPSAIAGIFELRRVAVQGIGNLVMRKRMPKVRQSLHDLLGNRWTGRSERTTKIEEDAF